MDEVGLKRALQAGKAAILEVNRLGGTKSHSLRHLIETAKRSDLDL